MMGREGREAASADPHWKWIKQSPAAFKITDIFFKYVSWLGLLAATKFVDDRTHDIWVHMLIYLEYAFYIWSLSWLALYLTYSVFNDPMHPAARHPLLGIAAILFAIVVFGLSVVSFAPLDEVVDKLEHRG